MKKSEEINILVVDDEPANLGVLFDYLSSQGFKVFLAENGEDALEAVHLSKPDLILLDISMPKLDGFETCRLLKSDRDTVEIPIIFLTARTDVIDKVIGFKLGAVDYITKPIEVEEVLMRINMQLKNHHKIQHLTKQVQSQDQHTTRVAKQYGMNARETEVLKLFTQGYKRPNIAMKLDITENTLKWYLKVIYTKLEVNNRTDAIAKAREMGL